MIILERNGSSHGFEQPQRVACCFTGFPQSAAHEARLEIDDPIHAPQGGDAIGCQPGLERLLIEALSIERTEYTRVPAHLLDVALEENKHVQAVLEPRLEHELLA